MITEYDTDLMIKGVIIRRSKFVEKYLGEKIKEPFIRVLIMDNSDPRKNQIAGVFYNEVARKWNFLLKEGKTYIFKNKIFVE